MTRIAPIVELLGAPRGRADVAETAEELHDRVLRGLPFRSLEAVQGRLGLERDQAGGKAERVRPCNTCGGTGKAPMPPQYRREIREAVYVMEQRRGEIGARVKRKMRRREEVE